MPDLESPPAPELSYDIMWAGIRNADSLSHVYWLFAGHPILVPSLSEPYIGFVETYRTEHGGRTLVNVMRGHSIVRDVDMRRIVPVVPHYDALQHLGEALRALTTKEFLQRKLKWKRQLRSGA